MTRASVELTDSVAELVLRNPPLNLVDHGMIDDLERALEEVAERIRQGTCRALILRADGRIFCAGVDVHTFLGHDREAGVRHIARFLAFTQRLEALPVPTMSVVHDLCLTIGFEISLGCDLLWAAGGTKFGLVEAKVGLTPGAGGTQRLLARAGYARAAELVYSGDLYSAEQLMSWGVVSNVLPADVLLPEARAFARRLANGPPLANAVAKSILACTQKDGVAAADRITAHKVGPLLTTQDLADGVRSLLDQGPGHATFRGR